MLISKIIKYYKKPYLKVVSVLYENWKLKWEYKKSKKRYEVIDIRPICPVCDCDLIKLFGHDRIYCPKCKDITYELFLEHNKIEAKTYIEDAIKKNKIPQDIRVLLSI